VPAILAAFPVRLAGVRALVLGLQRGAVAVLLREEIVTVRLCVLELQLILQNVTPSSVIGIFGLNNRTREEDLRQEFEKYGDIENVCWRLACVYS
jgi:hypothetical protein